MEHSKTKAVLIKARALIDTPDRWVQHYYSVQKDGVVKSYCASGALHAAATRDEGDRAWEALYDAIEGRTGGNWGGVATWNDDPGRTHAEIMQAFDWAIADLN